MTYLLQSLAENVKKSDVHIKGDQNSHKFYLNCQYLRILLKIAQTIENNKIHGYGYSHSQNRTFETRLSIFLSCKSDNWEYLLFNIPLKIIVLFKASKCDREWKVAITNDCPGLSQITMWKYL